MVAFVRHMTLLLALNLVVGRFARADERPIESDSVWRSIPADAATRWVPRPAIQPQPASDAIAVKSHRAATVRERLSPTLPNGRGSEGFDDHRMMPTSDAVKSDASALPGASELIRLAGGTVIAATVGLIALIALRRSGWGTARSIARLSPLQHGGSIPLGARNSLHLVTVGEQRFLVAVDPRGVSSIAAVAESFPELHEALGEASATDAPERSVLPFAKRA